MPPAAAGYKPRRWPKGSSKHRSITYHPLGIEEATGEADAVITPSLHIPDCAILVCITGRRMPAEPDSRLSKFRRPALTITTCSVKLEEGQRDLYETSRDAIAQHYLAESHIVALDALLKLHRACRRQQGRTAGQT